MLNLVIAMCCTLPGQQTIQIQIPQPQYRVQVQQVYPAVPRYYYAKPAPQPNVRYLQPLQPGDIIINQRVGLFGFRTQPFIYRRP